MTRGSWEGNTSSIWTKQPKSVSKEHWSRCQDPHSGVVLLGNLLEIVGVLPLPLGPPVLEPYLDLGFRQSELLRELHPLANRQILIPFKLRLESLDLSRGERR